MLMALEYILENRVRMAVLFIDSQSALLAVCSITVTKNRLVQQAHIQMNRDLLFGLVIKLCWLPGHVDITGNEAADTLATSVNGDLEASVGPPYEDFKLVIKSRFINFGS